MATAAAGGSDRLGENLLRDGLLSREQLAQALAEQKASKQRLGFVLVKLGLVPEIEITKVLARQYRMPAVDLSRFDVDPKILKLVPGRHGDQGRRPPAQARGPHPHRRHGRSRATSACSKTSSSSPGSICFRSSPANTRCAP